jgi:hypothetical protein
VNILSRDKQIEIIAALTEGVGIGQPRDGRPRAEDLDDRGSYRWGGDGGAVVSIVTSVRRTHDLRLRYPALKIRALCWVLRRLRARVAGAV